MIEALGVILSLFQKWMKASGRKRCRRIGFWFAIPIAFYWIWYFVQSQQLWLVDTVQSDYSFPFVVCNNKGPE